MKPRDERTTQSVVDEACARERVFPFMCDERARVSPHRISGSCEAPTVVDT